MSEENPNLKLEEFYNKIRPILDEYDPMISATVFCNLLGYYVARGTPRAEILGSVIARIVVHAEGYFDQKQVSVEQSQ